MIINKLTKNDKQNILMWKYTTEYATFSYATGKGGWIDKYCCGEDAYCFGVRDQDELVGVFLFIAKHNNEFRVLINPSCLRRGYGKQITHEALTMGFEELKFELISLIVRQNHPVAIKLYEELGFVKDGETVQVLNGAQVDFYTMLKSKPL